MESVELWGLLSPRLKTQVSSGLSLEDVAEFCKVSTPTVVRWLHDKFQPVGEGLLRLWYLLRETGSPSPEIEDLDPFIRRLGELFAFDVMSAREAQEISGQTSPAVSQIYVTMRSGKRLMDPKLTLGDLDELYGEALAVKRDGAKALMRISSSQDDRQPEPISIVPAPQPGPKKEARVTKVTYGPDPDLTLASLLSAAAPLAKSLNVDGSPERRSAFRELIGMENLFDLSNTLNALCSERARRMV